MRTRPACRVHRSAGGAAIGDHVDRGVAAHRGRRRRQSLPCPPCWSCRRTIVDDIVALAVEEYPYEACGLLAGPAGGDEVDPLLPLPQRRRVGAGVHDRSAATTCAPSATPRTTGWEIIGVVHSHTHTEAYPSPTDVAQAPDPGWHYAIVSLRDETDPSAAQLPHRRRRGHRGGRRQSPDDRPVPSTAERSRAAAGRGYDC